jgi:stress response protein YsnF
MSSKRRSSKDINLRDERVIVERRPVSGAAATTARMPQEREFEVVERHEEPVVEKQARNVEEVIVRTDAKERTETVRDTVRQTRVDVENEAGGRADNLERSIPEDRKP